jgi:hypothetical protein
MEQQNSPSVLQYSNKQTQQPTFRTLPTFSSKPTYPIQQPILAPFYWNHQKKQGSVGQVYSSIASIPKKRGNGPSPSI